MQWFSLAQVAVMFPGIKRNFSLPMPKDYRPQLPIPAYLDSINVQLVTPLTLSSRITFYQMERVPDSPSPAPSLEDGRRPGSHPSSHRSSSVSSSPARTESSSDRIPVHQNGLSMNQTLMGLSPNVVPCPKEGDLATHDMGREAKRIHLEKGPTARTRYCVDTVYTGNCSLLLGECWHAVIVLNPLLQKQIIILVK
ncbi:UNVERIFIED_CONTAM: hypothetical protein FKN15_066083 [Acipenser sinensis]